MVGGVGLHPLAVHCSRPVPGVAPRSDDIRERGIESRRRFVDPMPRHEGTFLPRPTPVVGLQTDTAIAAHNARSGAVMRVPPYGRCLRLIVSARGRPVASCGTRSEVTVDIPTTSTTSARLDQLFTADEETALAGFLAGYSGLTREAYALDLRQYVQWTTEHAVPLFGARRADVESFGRHLECLGRARATIARRLCTIACFYRYAEEEGLISVSPAVHVRRPRLDYESHTVGLDRNEVGAMLVAAGLAGVRETTRCLACLR